MKTPQQIADEINAENETPQSVIEEARENPLTAEQVVRIQTDGAESVSYCIQVIMPSGSYYDSVSLPKPLDETEARRALKSWKKTFPDRGSRLIQRIARVIET